MKLQKITFVAFLTVSFTLGAVVDDQKRGQRRKKLSKGKRSK